MTEEFGGQALTKIPGVNLDGGSNPIVPASVDTPDVAKKPNLEDSVDTPKVEDIVSKPESTDTLKVEDQPNPIVDNINPTLEDKVAQPVDNINPGSANEVQADVAFTPVHEWNGGFTGKVQITNNSSEAVSDWELEFSAPFEIKEIWNGSIESQSGNKYLIADAGWNASIAPGQSVHFGFNGSNSDDMKLALNGVEFNQV
ncbi:MAG: cellulose binding domain-containing protein [Cyanobacteria bacterium P01_A01_bin.45]